MYKICFYAPIEQVDAIKQAMFAAGAGQLGNYSGCSWQVLGEGQFIPLAGSNAYLGKPHYLEKVAEYKVEMVCAEECMQSVILALKQTHPYETPAYQVIKVEDF